MTYKRNFKLRIRSELFKKFSYLYVIILLLNGMCLRLRPRYQNGATAFPSPSDSMAKYLIPVASPASY